MKLRLEQNSIRLRVRRSELALLQQQGMVQTSVTFPESVLHYVLRVHEAGDFSVLHDERTITVSLPAHDARQWIESDAVGLYYTADTGKGIQLQVSVEKDFACTTRANEDKADLFSPSSTGSAC